MSGLPRCRKWICRRLTNEVPAMKKIAAAYATAIAALATFTMSGGFEAANGIVIK